jgi:hypothetical protein
MRFKKIVQIFFCCFLFAENAALADGGRGFGDCQAFKSGLVKMDEKNTPHQVMKFEYNFRAKNSGLYQKYIQRRVFLDGNECQAGCKGEMHFKNESGQDETVPIKAYIAYYSEGYDTRKIESKDKVLTPEESRLFLKTRPENFYQSISYFYLSQDEKKIIKLADVYIIKDDVKNKFYEEKFLHTEVSKINVDDVPKEAVMNGSNISRIALACLTVKYPPLKADDPSRLDPKVMINRINIRE